MKRRGSALVTVTAVLALLTLLMGTGMQLLVSHLNESRRRGDSAYAGELARSGLDWARACIAGGGSGCSTKQELAGGGFEVKATWESEAWTVVSRGFVQRGSAGAVTREASTRLPAASYGSGGGASWPPARAEEPAPPTSSTGGGTPARSGVANPPAAPREPTSQETPRYF